MWALPLEKVKKKIILHVNKGKWSLHLGDIDNWLLICWSKTTLDMKPCYELIISPANFVSRVPSPVCFTWCWVIYRAHFFLRSMHLLPLPSYLLRGLLASSESLKGRWVPLPYPTAGRFLLCLFAPCPASYVDIGLPVAVGACQLPLNSSDDTWNLQATVEMNSTLWYIINSRNANLLIIAIRDYNIPDQYKQISSRRCNYHV